MDIFLKLPLLLLLPLVVLLAVCWGFLLIFMLLDSFIYLTEFFLRKD